MTKVELLSPEDVADDQIRFVVAAVRYQEKWVFSRHKARSTWDMPGGRREAGETVSEAMRRELWEETGATKADVCPAFAYSVTREGATTYGMVFYVQVQKLGPLPSAYEMTEICIADRMPEKLTWPEIQPALFSWVQGWMNMQCNREELWDLYDENRILTGKLHRRGEILPKGYYHLVAHVWVVNADGKFLITKRSSEKGFPNMWECTGGSALAGDDSMTAALREVREETGLILEPEKGMRILSVRKGDYFRDVWVFRHSFELSQVTLQPGETVDKCLADREEILKRYHNGEFVPYDYLEELFSRI